MNSILIGYFVAYVAALSPSGVFCIPPLLNYVNPNVWSKISECEGFQVFSNQYSTTMITALGSLLAFQEHHCTVRAPRTCPVGSIDMIPYDISTVCWRLHDSSIRVAIYNGTTTKRETEMMMSTNCSVFSKGRAYLSNQQPFAMTVSVQIMHPNNDENWRIRKSNAKIMVHITRHRKGRKLCIRPYRRRLHRYHITNNAILYGLLTCSGLLLCFGITLLVCICIHGRKVLHEVRDKGRRIFKRGDDDYLVI